MMKPFAVLGFLLAGGAVMAGAKYSLPVEAGPSYAWGSMGQARASANTIEYIGCMSYASATVRFAFCSARDAAGDSASCRTYDDKFIRVAESAGSDSTLEFHVDTDGYTCRSITVMNDSRYQPRQP